MVVVGKETCHTKGHTTHLRLGHASNVSSRTFSDWLLGCGGTQEATDSRDISHVKYNLNRRAGSALYSDMTKQV